MGHSSVVPSEKDPPCEKCNQDWQRHTLLGMKDGVFHMECDRDPALGIDPNLQRIDDLLAAEKNAKSLEDRLTQRVADREDEHKARIQTLEQELRQKSLRLQDLEARAGRQDEVIRETCDRALDAQKRVHAAEIDPLRQKLADHAELQTKLAESENNYRLAKSGNDALIADAHKLNEALAKAKEETAKARFNLNLAEGELEQLRSDYESLKKGLENQTIRVGQLEAQLLARHAPATPPPFKKAEEKAPVPAAPDTVQMPAAELPNEKEFLVPDEVSVIEEKEAIAIGGGNTEALQSMDLIPLDPVSKGEEDEEEAFEAPPCDVCGQTAVAQAPFEPKPGATDDDGQLMGPATLYACLKDSQDCNGFQAALGALEEHFQNPPKDLEELRKRFRPLYPAAHLVSNDRTQEEIRS